MKTSRARAVCLLLIGALLLAACGDDDDTAVTSDPAPTTEAPEPDPQPESEPEPDPGPDCDAGDDVDGCLQPDPEPCTEDDADADECLEPVEGYITLNGNGVDTDVAVASFGDDAESVIDLVSDYWGPSDLDTGDQPVGPDCIVSGDEYRRVEWGDRNLLFVDGVFDYWMSSDPDQNTEAFIGDASTVSILPGHTTVAELTESLGDLVTIDDEPFGPSFWIEDNFGQLFGFLTDTAPDGIVETINAGTGCAE